MNDLSHRLAWDLDEALCALTELLAVVNVAHSVAGISAAPTSLEDPSKHRVANTVGRAALVARQVLEKHGRLDDLNRSVRERYGSTE